MHLKLLNSEDTEEATGHTRRQHEHHQYSCFILNESVHDGLRLAVGETVILLHPPLLLVGVSIGMWMGRQQNDRLADG